MKHNLLISITLLLASITLGDFLSISNDLTKFLIYHNVGWLVIFGVLVSISIALSQVVKLHKEVV